MMHLLHSEIFRLRKRPQAWILALIMVLAVGAFYGSLAIAATVMSDPEDTKESLVLPNIFENGMQIVTLVGYILTVVLASGLIGNEYSWNTIRPLVARSRSRSALLSAKWITVFLYSSCLFLVGLVTTIAFSSVSSAVVGAFEGVDAALLADWVLGFARVLVSQLPYVALAFSLALITRSNAVGIAVGIGMGFLEPAIWGLLGLVTDAFDSVRKFGLEYPSTLLFNMNSEMEDVSTGEAWRAVATLAVWVVILVSATYYFFNKRDITSG
jgi:ABC-type transport system involved in multi-copper enzyme maturation permease subunit